jgi:hypothetical protein
MLGLVPRPAWIAPQAAIGDRGRSLKEMKTIDPVYLPLGPSQILYSRQPDLSEELLVPVCHVRCSAPSEGRFLLLAQHLLELSKTRELHLVDSNTNLSRQVTWTASIPVDEVEAEGFPFYSYFASFVEGDKK